MYLKIPLALAFAALTSAYIASNETHADIEKRCTRLRVTEYSEPGCPPSKETWDHRGFSLSDVTLDDSMRSVYLADCNCGPLCDGRWCAFLGKTKNGGGCTSETLGEMYNDPPCQNILADVKCLRAKQHGDDCSW